MNSQLTYDARGNLVPCVNGDITYLEGSVWSSEDDLVRGATPLRGWYESEAYNPGGEE